MKLQIKKTFTQLDVDGWQYITGDMNKLHYDEKFCEGTRFKRPILPGLLVASLFSNLFGSIDGAVYHSQELHFIRPTFAGEQLTAYVERIKNDRWRCEVMNEDGWTVLTGEATIIL